MSTMGGEYQRIRYENKKADGQCTRCADRRMPGRTMCARHCEYMAAQTKVRRAVAPPRARYVSRETKVARVDTPAGVVVAVASSWSIERGGR